MDPGNPRKDTSPAASESSCHEIYLAPAEANSASFRHRLAARPRFQQVLVAGNERMNYWACASYCARNGTILGCNGIWSKTGLEKKKHCRKWLVCSHRQVCHGLPKGKQRKWHHETWGAPLHGILHHSAIGLAQIELGNSLAVLGTKTSVFGALGMFF